MKAVLIELPIDFGHSENGKYHPLGQRKGSSILSQVFSKWDCLNESARMLVQVNPPEKDESWDCPLKFDTELFEAIQMAVGVISEVILQGGFPLLFGGDHSISLATALGISQSLKENKKAQPLGAIVWDAHTDFNLPGKVVEQKQDIFTDHSSTFTISGNAHGMIHGLLGKLTDSQFLLASLSREISLVDPSRIVILGSRSKRYPQLQETLDKANPLIITNEEIKNTTEKEMGKIMRMAFDRATGDGTAPFYLSFDCDVLDPDVFSGVATPVKDGLHVHQIKTGLLALTRIPNFRKWIKGFDISEYCSDLDNKPTESAEGLTLLFKDFLEFTING